MFKELLNEDVDSLTILKKVAKKNFGKTFKSVEMNDSGYIIQLNDNTLRYNDLKGFEINLSSYRIGDILMDKNQILVGEK